jgi:hypothetical protein
MYVYSTPKVPRSKLKKKLDAIYQLLVMSFILGTVSLPLALRVLRISAPEDAQFQEKACFRLPVVQGPLYNLAQLRFKQMYPEKTLVLVE